MMDEIDAALRIQRLEQDVAEMRDKEIGATLFAFNAAKDVEPQRVFSDGGGGGASVAPRSFDVRIVWRQEKDDNGNDVSVACLDVYQPYVEFYVFVTETIIERHIAQCASPLVDVGNGWYQFAKMGDWTKQTSFLVSVDLSALGANKPYVESEATYKLCLSDNDTVVVLGGGERPSVIYPNSVMDVTIAQVYAGYGGVNQHTFGPCSINYVSSGAQALYAKIGDVWTDDFSHVTFSNDAQIYFCTLLIAEVAFSGSKTMKYGIGKPPVIQGSDTPVFSAKVACALHATDHYENFIPQSESASL